MRTTTLAALVIISFASGCDSAELGKKEAATITTSVDVPIVARALDAYDLGDYSAAVKHATPLATRGNPLAQYLLGSAHANAERPDLALADHWLTLSAEQGFTPAMRDLGHLHLLYMAEPNWDRALEWYGKAAERGDVEAQQALGVLHVNAFEAHVVAYKWLLLAGTPANTESSKLTVALLEKLASQLSPVQIAEADRAARKWGSQRTDAAASGTLAFVTRSASSKSMQTKLERHMASNSQLRYGQLVGDILGLDAVFGALLFPAAGLIGKATWQPSLESKAA